ncbi:Nucleotidyltransferase domain containing protein [Histomonas meleagridis]|uniref:Nucleotidyltransferase domain containing protein n=1 Tax=Histomonas meleagridis TaxID=135588 RepID=UPI00355999DE|nr:Nucleotidyltransferase domain containing protein [Histomonas meleagridis]KAH0802223.1 Nucleotidyltransferase domain containing protein [Histomonas meleagridis]
MENVFAILRENSNLEDLYDVGPWAEETCYFEPEITTRLHHEILDIAKWLEPTEFEERVRLLVITRFTKLIQDYFPECVCIPQGSSSNGTYLPVSDIDLIVLNVLSNIPISTILRTLTKIFLKSRMISNFLVLDHATVPIVKLTERPFGFKIDICISNINGALNVPRVRSILKSNPLFKPMLMFIKLFIYANKIDDPSTGGFGSNQLINLVLFAFQSCPDASNLGELLIYLFDILANKINYFLTGISTIDGGKLFSKEKTNMVTERSPEAFLFEDPQFHDRFFGCRTSHSITLRTICKKALHSFAVYDYSKRSAISSILPDISELIDRRKEMEKYGRMLKLSPADFGRVMETTSGMIGIKKKPKTFKIQEPKFIQEQKKKSKTQIRKEKAAAKKMNKQQKRIMKKQNEIEKKNAKRRSKSPPRFYRK